MGFHGVAPKARRHTALGCRQLVHLMIFGYGPGYRSAAAAANWQPTSNILGIEAKGVSRAFTVAIFGATRYKVVETAFYNGYPIFYLVRH